MALVFALQSVPPGPLLTTLRADAVGLIFCVVLVGIGMFVLALAIFRRPASRLELLAFGLFSSMYGARLIAEVDTTSLVLGWPPVILQAYVSAALTYFIPIPIIWLLELALGPGWHRQLTIARRVALAYALVAVVIDGLAGPFRALVPYEVGIVVWCTIGLVNLMTGAGFDTGRRMRPLRLGWGCTCLFVLNENLVSLGVMPWSIEVEAPVVFGLICFLGYVAARHALDKQKQLDAIEHELNTARRIQSSILPKGPPALPALDVAARHVPMTAVGGDFYEFLPGGDSQLGVLVADVSGHGVPAALIASMLKIGIASQASHASTPARVLSGLYETFHDRLEHQYITAGYAFIDPDRRVLRAATAGHPPLLLHRRRAGTVEPFGPNGLVIGLLPASGYDEAATPIEPGDRILLYSDGVTEAGDRRGEFFDQTGLREFILTHADLDAEPFADTLLRHLAARAGHASSTQSFDDDLTFVVIDVRTAG